jgi:DNA polymerase-3 subunit delta'
MTFDQILGHESQKEILRRALASGRLAHAYLFEGPEGIGKRLIALAVARAVFCIRGTGCGDCIACRKVDHHNHPDLHILEPEGKGIKIDQVRKLQRDLALRPLEAKKKICLIDHADCLNPAGGNALLKTLEEPPGDALLILLAAHPERLLSTIRSRCQRLPFRHLPRAELQQVMTDQLGVSETESHILASLAEGSFKKALGKDRQLYLEQRIEILKQLTALSPGAVLPRLELAEKLGGQKEQLQEILEIIQAFLRDLLLHKHGRPDSELVNLDLTEKIARVSSRETIPGLLNKLEAIAETRRILERNVNPQLAMEVLLQKLAA